MRFLVPLLLLFAAPAFAQDGLQQRVEAKLAEAGPGVRFGLVVTDAEGREIVAVNPEQRFIPASNTKMFTTAAVFWAMPGIDQPDAAGGNAVRIEGKHVVLVGNGDARMSSADDCAVDCLATLADAIAAKIRKVRDVIGDDTLFADQRWSPGMSWNNIPTTSGTGISALTLDDNELHVVVTPGEAGQPVKLASLGYFEIDNQIVTVASGGTEIGADRDPFSLKLRLTGTIAADAKPRTLNFGIDDPAHYAAWRLKGLLKARGVKVSGQVLARHRRQAANDDDVVIAELPVASMAAAPLAQLVPAPLKDDLRIINKASQNLHAELAIRRLGLAKGSGSIADGQVQVSAMLTAAGVPRTAYDFSDGSGMSSYNRVAPRGMTVFLKWIAAQPWGGAYRETLPIGGVDGTLSRRFKGTSLEGRIFAKTGTLNATNALSGWLVAKSGRTLTFSAFANDVPSGVRATPAMDAALVLVAEGN